MFSSSASAGSVTQMIAVSLDAVAQTYSAEKNTAQPLLRQTQNTVMVCDGTGQYLLTETLRKYYIRHTNGIA